jgi:hypothetical protein
MNFGSNSSRPWMAKRIAVTAESIMTRIKINPRSAKRRNRLMRLID